MQHSEVGLQVGKIGVRYLGMVHATLVVVLVVQREEGVLLSL